MRKGTPAMLAVLFGTAFIAAFNENIVNVGLVDIMAEFSIDSGTAQWLVTGYMIVTAVIVTIVAFLLKRIRLRTLFFFGSGVMIAGSAAAMLAPTFTALLVARLMQSIGIGIFIPTMMNTVLACVPRKKLGAYLSIGSCCITFGPAFGPVASGLMVTMLGWRSMFLVPAVAMTALLLVGIFLVRNIGEPEPVRLDVLSVLMSALGLTALVYGLSEATSNPPLSLGTIGLGIAIIVLFVRRQSIIEHPLINLAPLHDKLFAIACGLEIVCMMTTFSMSVLLPLYLEGACGASALLAGFLMLIPILLNAIAALAGGRIMDAHGSWPLLPIGFIFIVIGQIMVYFVASDRDAVTVILFSVVVYAGVGAVMSPTQTAGLRNLPQELGPYGIGIMSTFIQVAAAIGPSLLVGILSSTIAMQTADGIGIDQATANGFSSAILLTAIIAAVGAVCSIGFARAGAREGKIVQASAMSLGLTLDAIMKRDVFSISASATVHEAVALMIEHSTSGLPVTDMQGNLVGFISDGDIMKSLANTDQALIDLTYSLSVYADDERFDARLTRLMEANVMDVANNDIISVDVSAPIELVCTILGERRIKKMPVTQGDALIGSISRRDVTRHLMESFLEKAQRGLAG